MGVRERGRRRENQGKRGGEVGGVFVPEREREGERSKEKREGLFVPMPVYVGTYEHTHAHAHAFTDPRTNSQGEAHAEA